MYSRNMYFPICTLFVNTLWPYATIYLISNSSFSRCTFSIHLLEVLWGNLWDVVCRLVFCLLNKLSFPPFSEIVRLLMSMQVDRMNQRRLFWSGKYVNPNSKEYKTLEGESNYAVSVKIKVNQVSPCVHVATKQT